MRNAQEEAFNHNTDISYGLSKQDVAQRKEAGLSNKIKQKAGKSTGEILFTNLITFFNILLFVIAGFLIAAGKYTSLAFFIICILNIGLGLFQDIKANVLLKRLRIVVDSKIQVLREGQKEEINADEVVLDDICFYKSSNQIVADSVILEGTVGVNESLLTGESLTVYKNPGDSIFAGSYIVSGSCKCRAVKVGKNNYSSNLLNIAKKKKALNSQIKQSLNDMFVIIGLTVITVGAITIIFRLPEIQANFSDEIGKIAGSLVGMIPSGLYLLTSMTLSVGVINLAQKGTMVQDFYSIEMLARATCLCIDKTGTITDGTMKVENLKIVDSSYDYHKVQLLLSNLIHATNDSNATATAIKEAYNYEATEKASAVLPFDSKNKYSAATFKEGTFVLGAADFLNFNDDPLIKQKIKQFAEDGYRVMLFAKVKGEINKGKIDSTVSPIAIIVIRDNLRQGVIETFEWFKSNNVKIKVISGDDPLTVSNIAKKAGIENAESYISLFGKTDEEIIEIAGNYTIFGRVTPEQKEVLVKALQKQKETIAMVGDGVNDILALKKADCSIAMANGSDAARNVSNMVLVENDFNCMPKIVAEGRRVINNIQRTGSLFLAKTIFACVASIAFLVAAIVTNNKNIGYPYLPNHLYLWEFTIIGLGSFFIALEPNAELVKGKFLSNVFAKAIPAGLLMIFCITTLYVLRIFDLNYSIYLGLKDEQTFIAMSVVILSVLPLVMLFDVCRPFSKYRLIVFISACALNVILLGVGFLLDLYAGGDQILMFSFKSLGPINWIELGVGLIGFTTLYFYILKIISSIKEARGGSNEN